MSESLPVPSHVESGSANPEDFTIKQAMDEWANLPNKEVANSQADELVKSLEGAMSSLYYDAHGNIIKSKSRVTKVDEHGSVVHLDKAKALATAKKAAELREYQEPAAVEPVKLIPAMREKRIAQIETELTKIAQNSSAGSREEKRETNSNIAHARALREELLELHRYAANDKKTTPKTTPTVEEITTPSYLGPDSTPITEPIPTTEPTPTTESIATREPLGKRLKNGAKKLANHPSISYMAGKAVGKQIKAHRNRVATETTLPARAKNTAKRIVSPVVATERTKIFIGEKLENRRVRNESKEPVSRKKKIAVGIGLAALAGAAYYYKSKTGNHGVSSGLNHAPKATTTHAALTTGGESHAAGTSTGTALANVGSKANQVDLSDSRGELLHRAANATQHNEAVKAAAQTAVEQGKYTSDVAQILKPGRTVETMNSALAKYNAAKGTHFALTPHGNTTWIMDGKRAISPKEMSDLDKMMIDMLA